MKLSEQLQRDNDSGDFGKALEGYSERAKELEEALEKIARWIGEFPETGDKWDDGTPVSYGAAFGSNGERDYMRTIASDALKKASA
jgi:hypothetical protein